MSRMVFCRKYQTEMAGLDAPPYPGPRGEAIYQQVSQQAWQEWLAHQTRLINEQRLNMMESKARKFLQEEMERFLSGADLTQVEGYVQPKQ